MKKGISLIVLGMVVVLLGIIATVVVVSADGLIGGSKLTSFATSMSKIQDSITTYYATRGVLPIVYNSTEFSKDSLLSFVGEEKAEFLSTEMNKNGDDNSKFYYIDVDKLALENLTLDITPTSRNLVVNSDGTHVYYIQGYKLDNTIYFSVTKDMK